MSPSTITHPSFRCPNVRRCSRSESPIPKVTAPSTVTDLFFVMQPVVTTQEPLRNDARDTDIEPRTIYQQVV